jgi:chemotaxis protein methyltransferase CheR
MCELGLVGYQAYREHIGIQPAEWQVLDGLCRITISRFYRDKGVFDLLGASVLPELAERAQAEGQNRIDVWSAGCGSGEEPYTVALLWEHLVKPTRPECEIDILSTDANALLLRRAAEARYSASSLKDLPEDLRRAFEPAADDYSLAPQYRVSVRFLAHDVRTEPPLGPFDLILCRNLAFTYFDEQLQLETARRLTDVMRPSGYLVIGAHEELPGGIEGLSVVDGCGCVWRAG